jgi:hypothetical protein
MKIYETNEDPKFQTPKGGPFNSGALLSPDNIGSADSLSKSIIP